MKRCASTALHALMSASHPPGDAGAARTRKAKAAARPCSRVSPRRKPPRASLAPSQPSSRPSQPAGTTSRAPCLPPSSSLSSPLSLAPCRQALTRSTSTGAPSPSPPGAVESAQEPSPRSSQPAGAAREQVDAAGAPLVLSERSVPAVASFAVVLADIASCNRPLSHRLVRRRNRRNLEQREASRCSEYSVPCRRIVYTMSGDMESYPRVNLNSCRIIRKPCRIKSHRFSWRAGRQDGGFGRSFGRGGGGLRAQYGGPEMDSETFRRL